MTITTKYNNMSIGDLSLIDGYKDLLDEFLKERLDRNILSRADAIVSSKTREVLNIETLQSSSADMLIMEEQMTFNLTVQPTDYFALASRLDPASVKVDINGVREYGYTHYQSLLENAVSFYFKPSLKTTFSKPRVYFNCILTNPDKNLNVSANAGVTINLEFTTKGVTFSENGEVRTIHFIEFDDEAGLVQWCKAFETKNGRSPFNLSSETTNGFILE